MNVNHHTPYWLAALARAAGLKKRARYWLTVGHEGLRPAKAPPN